jgi:phosphomannomutase
VPLIKSISGIRGTIGGITGENLTPLDIVKFAAAFGMWLKKKSGTTKIIIGRDARPSGEMVSSLVTSTLQGLGINVIDLGLSTTPTVEIAVPLEKASGGIIITASHNPAAFNGFKIKAHFGGSATPEITAEVEKNLGRSRVLTSSEGIEVVGPEAAGDASPVIGASADHTRTEPVELCAVFVGVRFAFQVPSTIRCVKVSVLAERCAGASSR